MKKNLQKEEQNFDISDLMQIGNFIKAARTPDIEITEGQVSDKKKLIAVLQGLEKIEKLLARPKSEAGSKAMCILNDAIYNLQLLTYNKINSL